MRKNRRPGAILAAGFAIALVNWMSIVRQPDFHAIRNVQVVHLLATGAVIGASITGAIAAWRRGPER